MPTLPDLRITSIDQLLKELDACDTTEYGSVVKRIKITKVAEDLIWCTDAYTRNCIKQTENYEVIVICWEEGHETPIHGHDGQKCWVYQVQGEMEDEHFTQGEHGLKSIAKFTSKEGCLSFMNEEEKFHRLSNSGSGRAMSIHIYANPIIQCEVYNETEACFENKEMEYDKSF